ncbi:MAG: acetyl-CoA carboxylase biotin carboxylase subunit [Firmicutes bacterium]|nr:acetyl-CoA carboxylase biotin carboxylase subunit [Bacillota bacterium]
MKRFSKILIANRGEIAVRLIRTCRVMGIKTVLAASEADKDSLAARLADETVIIGGPGVATYLDIPAIIQTAKDVGAEALHPGYGFLAEQPELPEACKKAGVVFIGPKTENIVNMGNKLVARSLAEKSGVPCLPGSEKVNSFEDVLDVVGEIGFPVMLKAAAGGGGRGMKIVSEENKGKLEQAFNEASAESRAAFGDSSLFVEKYIAHARHIEVQIIGDKYGNVVHLGERDCSTQRRHQKLIEEAGAPNITEKLRKELHASAVKLGEFIGYESAGTVEFLVDQDSGKFYFLEVNTRVQVEHPVTEEVTGVDLIEEMINVAAGEKLSFSQEEITFSGHAIECRINAEIAEENFRPTPGKITRWEIPQGPGIRVDSHCYVGYTIPIFYDSLIGKLIVHGRNRDHAIRKMLAALDEFAVEGISTTVSFHHKFISTPDFKAGKVHTRLLEDKLQHILQ